MVVDRKIKNYDASIELLEDRIKILDYLGYFLYIGFFIAFIFSVITYGLSGLIGTTVIGIGFSLFLLICCMYFWNVQGRIGILIYLKKHLEVEPDTIKEIYDKIKKQEEKKDGL